MEKSYKSAQRKFGKNVMNKNYKLQGENKNFHIKETKKEMKDKITNYEVRYFIDTSKITGVCPICSQNTVLDPSNIVIDNRVFHFDCVVNFLKQKFSIEENTKIIYTGSNTFGVFWEGKGHKKLELLKKIDLKESLNEYFV